MAWLITKYLITAGVIVLVSEVAKRSDKLGGLLGALPLVTIGLGELLGARPVQVLFGSAQGNACLAVGGAGYALGLLWMSSMMRNTGTNVDTV